MNNRLLNDVAFLSPSDAGDAVYIARMLLDTLIHDPEPPARYAEEKRTVEPSYSVVVFPNPAGTFINVRIMGDVEYPVQVRIIDLSGRTVQEKTQVTAEQQYSLDNLAAGTYLYEILNHSGLLQRGKLVFTKR
jgi:hypothetical protein